MVRIGVNGFGRLGRLFTKVAIDKCRQHRVIKFGLTKKFFLKRNKKIVANSQAVLLFYNSNTSTNRFNFYKVWNERNIHSVGMQNNDIIMTGPIYDSGLKGSPCDVPRVVVINDPNFTPVCMGYLLQNDTFYGKTCQEIVHVGNCIIVEGQRVETLQERDIQKIPWTKAGPIDYIVDTTGINVKCNSASKHLRDKIKRVITTGVGNDVPFYVFGVNHTCYKNDMKTVSAATPSMNCLASMLRIIHENFIIKKATSLAIHPFSNNNKILDDPAGSGSCRDSRSATINFCPTKSECNGESVAKIMPELFGKTESSAVRIPAPCVGAIDVTMIVEKEAPYEIVRVRLSEAAESYMKGIVRYSNEELVSSDLIGDPHSCIIDAKSGLHVPPNVIKLYGWYDSEYAFAQRLYDIVKYIASREQ